MAKNEKNIKVAYSYSFREIAKSWMDDNIFSNGIIDGLAYFILYFIIPVAIIVVDWHSTSGQNFISGYAYFSMLVCVSNCIYDAANRQVKDQSCILNTKLRFGMITNGVVAIYCLFMVLSALFTGTISVRCDTIFAFFGFHIIFTIIDFIYLCFKTWKSREHHQQLERGFNYDT